MKKRIINKVVLFLLVVSILILSGCGGRVEAGDKPLDTAAAAKIVQTGTQGIEVSLQPDYPPSIIYDLNELVALVDIKNKGNYNVNPQECFVQITGFDPNIIQGDFGFTRSCADGLGGEPLEGKNLFNTEGGFNNLEFYASNIALPDGVFEYSPNLNIVSCYNYITTASPAVCVDPQFYQVTTEQKTCQAKDVVLGGGQGGPVGVSYVGVDMVGNKAIFEINVRNMDSGRVLSPYADLRSCADASLQHTDLDRVGYVVSLSGGSLIDCKPKDGFVRLVNGQGKVVCSFNVPGGSSFQTPLIIDLDYGYIKSFQKQVKIIKTPQ